MNFFKFISDWINDNPGKAVGAFLGFLFGIFILTLGFLKTFIIILLVIVGLLIGKLKDDNLSIGELFSNPFKRRKD